MPLLVNGSRVDKMCPESKKNNFIGILRDASMYCKVLSISRRADVGLVHLLSFKTWLRSPRFEEVEAGRNPQNAPRSCWPGIRRALSQLRSRGPRRTRDFNNRGRQHSRQFPELTCRLLGAPCC